MSADATLDSTLNTALREISQRCDFVHAETLRPAGDASMVQGGSNYNADQYASKFHRASLNFQFPQYACVPGRVWKTMKSEWHQDVSLLPSAVFTRAEIAKISMLKACLALPLCRQGHLVSVVLFFSRSSIPYDQRLENTIINLANDILAEVCTRTGHPQLQFVSSGPVGPSKKNQMGTSKIWESAKVALAANGEARSKDDIENIIKFSKRLPFFKYVVNSCRESLCKEMMMMVLDKGEMPIKGKEDQEYVWFIVVKGRVDMLVRTERSGKQYPLRVFEDGDTFAHSYLSLLTGGREDIQGELVAAEAGTHVVRVEVLPEHRSDFKSLTKPLLFEELAKYFDVSADEAAEKLGVCMSAIKKICRRHGIIRWPHRKLLSANKALCLLDNKMQDPQDVGNLDALRSEAINILVSKLRVVLNPTYIINSELVQLLPIEGQGITGAGMISDDEESDDEGGMGHALSKANKAPPEGSNRLNQIGPSDAKKPKLKDAHSSAANQAAAEQSLVAAAGLVIDEMSKMLLNRLQHIPLQHREQVLNRVMETTRMAAGLGVPNFANGMPQQTFLGIQALTPAGMGSPSQMQQQGYTGSNAIQLQQHNQIHIQKQQMQQSGLGRTWPGQSDTVHHDGGVDELLDSDSSDEDDNEESQWNAQQPGAASVLSGQPQKLASLAGLLGRPTMPQVAVPFSPLQTPLMGISRLGNLTGGLGAGSVGLPNGQPIQPTTLMPIPAHLDQQRNQGFLQGQMANMHLLCDLLGGVEAGGGVLPPPAPKQLQLPQPQQQTQQLPMQQPPQGPVMQPAQQQQKQLNQKKLLKLQMQKQQGKNANGGAVKSAQDTFASSNA